MLRSGLKCILCVGETLEQREKGLLQEVLQRQIRTAFEHSGLRNRFEIVGSNPVSPLLAIAYEPVWAIGTGKTATPEDAQEVCAAIREEIGQIGSAEIAEKMRILYGGSVKSANIVEIMKQSDVDGALIGGASLDPEELAKIVKFHAQV